MKIFASDGTRRSAAQLAKQIISDALEPLEKCGDVLQQSIADDVKHHFQMTYPGSKHYSPDKVTNGKVIGSSAEVDVDVPGVSRAYRSLDIYPIRASRLAIPVNGTTAQPREVDGLFYTKNSKGTEMLAKMQNGALAVMYILKDHVHQDQRPWLMPSDEQLAENALQSVAEQL